MEPSAPKSQIVEYLNSDSVDLHGISHRLSDLCAGVLVTGATGSGKTTTIANPLAASIARLHADDDERRAAVFYLNSKGDGARDFLSRLPTARRRDIVYVGEAAAARLLFFDRAYWTDSTQLGEATHEFLLEASRFTVGSADREGNHKAYFEGIRDRPLRFLTHLAMATHPGAKSQAEWFAPRSHLIALVRRIREFITLVEKPSTGTGAIRLNEAARILKEVAAAHHMTPEDIHVFIDAASQAVRGNQKEQAVLQLARRLIDEALKSRDPKEKAVSDGTRGLMSALTPASASQLSDLIDSSKRVHQESRYSLTSELASLCDLFESGPLGRLVMPQRLGQPAISFEEVIDEGKILIVDLPVADSGGATRLALSLIALHIQQVALRRRVASIDGRAVNTRRPVVFVADEFPSYLCSRGRHDGLEQWLSRSREFGIIPILATQTIGLMAEALGSANRTRSVLANLRTRYMASCSCPDSNQWASWICGRHTRRSAGTLVNWRGDPAMERAISRRSLSDSPLVRSDEFSGLETGEYFLQMASGSVIRVNANYRFSKPQVTHLAGSRIQDT